MTPKHFFRRTNERPGTAHLTLGPMRGLEENCTQWRKHRERHPDGHGDSITELAQWGRFSENNKSV